MNLQVNALLIKEDGVWSAQCLEYNIAAQGATHKEAMLELARTIAGEILVRAADDVQGLADIPRAPDMYWTMFGDAVPLQIQTRILFHPDTEPPPAFMIPEFHELRVAS